MVSSVVFFVYRLTFAGGKVYIGMSRTDAKGLYTRRFKDHKRDAMAGSCKPVHRAWVKHGEPSQEILSRHATREECAAAEIAEIKAHDSMNPAKGYNLMAGGEGLNAPRGSRVHDLMREKVWDNPERRAKSSAALKGKPASAASVEAVKEWSASPEGRAKRRETALNTWAKPGHREFMSERTRQQMTPEARERLSKMHAGRADPRTPEGKEIWRQKQIAFVNSPAGKAACSRGFASMWSNPENRARMMAGADEWRSSERNRQQLADMAKLSSAACSKRVRDLKTGIEYESQRAMALALGLSDGAITYRVKAGTVARI